MKKISFVIPCYRSEHTIERVVQEIHQTMQDSLKKYCYEIVLISDHSPDNVYTVIKNLAAEDKRIKGICLAKNFGQHSALMAGYHYCSGDYVISLDDDGQTPINTAPAFIKKLEEGYDAVFASYPKKKESPFRLLGSWVNSEMAKILIGKPKDLELNSYYAAKKYVIEEMTRYTHAYPYIAGLVLRTTKNITNVAVDHRDRTEGTSGYTMKKLLSMWLNGFTAFSVLPLRIASVIGLVVFLFSIVYGIYTVINRFMNPGVPVGYSALMTVILCIGGLLMLILGLIGEYIGRIYICINQSPQYVIQEETDDNKEDFI